MEYDLVIKNGTVITEGGILSMDVAVKGEQFAALGPRGTLTALREIDATGLLILPGGIDTHVHFNEPGMSEWEDWNHGSRAAARGGVTTVVDMPVDNIPPTTDAVTLLSKKEVAQSKSCIDFCLWGGLTTGMLSTMEEMTTAGAAGWKAFLCDSGGPYFPMPDDGTLFEGMRIAAKMGAPLTLHCENNQMIAYYSDKFRKAGTFDNAAWSQIHSLTGELESVNKAILFSKLTGARLNIAHISSPQVADLITQAKEQGQDITAETCAHYLLFNEDDVLKRGTMLKCSPPIRGREHQEGLWSCLQDGRINFVASDHSPMSAEFRAIHPEDMDKGFGGIAGVQFTLNVLYSEGVCKRGISLPRLVQLTSANAACMLGIYGCKGAIAEGFDADFVLFNPQKQWTVTTADYLAKVKISPYIGQSFQGDVAATYLRGTCVYGEEATDTMGRGHMLIPDYKIKKVPNKSFSSEITPLKINL